MLKFGKKVSYRPLIFSFAIALVVGLLLGLNFSWTLGLEVGFVMFLGILIGHYFLVLPIIFNYWDTYGDVIRYNDIKSFRKRAFAIFFPKFQHLSVISRDNIRSISILGLPQRDSNLASELVLSEEGGFMYNLLLMINEPVKIRLTLADHTSLDLDLSRDYVGHPAETIGKLKLFLSGFNPYLLHIPEDAKKILI